MPTAKLRSDDSYLKLAAAAAVMIDLWESTPCATLTAIPGRVCLSDVIASFVLMTPPGLSVRRCGWKPTRRINCWPGLAVDDRGH